MSKHNDKRSEEIAKVTLDATNRVMSDETLDPYEAVAQAIDALDVHRRNREARVSNNGDGPHRKFKTEEFTFESTGVTIKYTRVPLQLIIDFESGWKRKHPAPAIPKNEVDIGGEKRVIDNPSDPDYQTALALHTAEMHNVSYRYMLKKAIVLSNEDMAEVKALQEEVSAEGSELDTSNPQWTFLFHIASTDPDEIGEFQNAVLRLSQPSKEAIDDAKARFPDTVPGA